MPSGLTLSGVDELLAELERLSPDLALEAGPLEQEMAGQTAEELRGLVPVVTGTLRDSIRVEPIATSKPGRVAASVVMAAPYAGFVEFGSAHIAPRSLFVPVTRRGREAFVRAVMDKVRDRGLVVSGGL